MMRAWEIPARTPDELARFVRALSKNRYVREVDHRVHALVDRALAPLAARAALPEAPERRFAQHAATQGTTLAGVALGSRDPRLWRPATLDELGALFRAFWADGEAGAFAARLEAELARAGLPLPCHPPFQPDPDDTPHPELVVLDWALLPVEELSTEAHAGALAAMEDDGEEVSPSEPLWIEGPYLTPAELLLSFPDGGVPGEFLVWCDGPYAYADYVLRGAAKAAKLESAPVGLRDLEEER